MSKIYLVCLCISFTLTFSAANAREYILHDLGSLGGSRSVAYGINDSGQVVGYSTDVNGVEHPIVWDEVQGMRIPDGLGNAAGYASAINNNGQIACNLGTKNQYHAARWDSATGLQYMNERSGDLFSYANGMDSSGQLVGVTGTSTYVTRAVLWATDGNIARDFCLGQATAINDNGWVVGYSYERNPWVESSFVWDSENGCRYIDTARAIGINESNTLVGWGAGHNDAYAWNPEDGIIRLSTLYPELYDASSADAINDAGILIGTAHTNYSSAQPFVLNAMNGLYILDNPRDDVLCFATGINNKGQIVGYWQSCSGEEHALLWTPVPEPTSIVCILFGMFLIYRKSRSGNTA